MSISKKLEQRLKTMEDTILTMTDRLDKLQEMMQVISHGVKKVEEQNSGQEIFNGEIKQKIKETDRTTGDMFISSEAKTDQRFEDMSRQLQEVGDRTLATQLRLNDMDLNWPTPKEGIELAEKLKNEKITKKRSFEEKFKNKAKDSIVILGDSLARGVGAKLEHQSHMVTAISKGGARIETISEEVVKMKNNKERHLVVIVGTNNIKKQGSQIVLDKYKDLLKNCQKVKNKKVSVVGIPKRTDISSYQNSRRIGVNIRLREMCLERNVEFIEYEPTAAKLASDGLHFSHAGQDELARVIFGHCKPFLV